MKNILFKFERKNLKGRQDFSLSHCPGHDNVGEKENKVTLGLLNWYGSKTVTEKQTHDGERSFRKSLKKSRFSGNAFLGSGQPSK